MQSEAVAGLCDLGEGHFAFTLLGGTVGVYRGSRLLWRAKTKAQPVAVAAVAMTQGAAVRHVAVAWADGTLEVYAPDTGRVLFRDDFPAPLAGLALVRVAGWRLFIVGSGRGCAHPRAARATTASTATCCCWPSRPRERCAGTSPPA